MDLKSGLPFWLIKNGLAKDYDTLDENTETEVLIIGSGITGALVAHFLCEAGVKCVIADKRMASTGSTTASTAQLQYEIDVYLHELIEIIGEEKAAKAYKMCLESIFTLQKIIGQMGIDGEFEMKSCLNLASDKTGANTLRREYKARKKHGLPCELLDKKQLKEKFNIDRELALYNDCSAIIDTFKLCTQILEYHKKKSGLKVYSHTEIVSIEHKRNGIVALTQKGNSIKAKKVVAAPGYESENLLDEKVMRLHSTYVLVSKPIKEATFWNEKCLIWETARPYIYIRSTADNRVMVGGFDEPFYDPKRRDKLMARKNSYILKRFHKLFPDIQIETDFYWCGTFGETKDGLPFIGEHENHPNMYFALGYGGNGITFSVIAAEIIRDLYLGKKTETELFAFGR
ncbi:NAD(P)/FAD-dependent oxidoreductase [Flavobacterium pallidum]|uniref:FAD-dependent oxidoreductase n=1 Tax=Flavobacterium pallidum TaxID=2172098 RepID=A0A2S1SJQ9_9FLAO|nr:FAD-dependent oxidoreductase [Flavobacterium pallidum]AWI26615.1 FAD-dependent oxidoreductase [Flavobacterium pallidum]